MNIRELIKTHQQKIALSVGYILVASLAFILGRITALKYEVPEVKIEQAFSPAVAGPSNYTPNIAGTQTETTTETPPKSGLNCQGKIKGSSSGIYHLPGGAFYTRTTSPTRCFDSEAQAKAAGFRKSSR